MQEPNYGPNDPLPPVSGAPGYGSGGGGTVNGTLLLILGILGILCCQILGPVTWVLAQNAQNTLDSGGGPQSERGMVNVAKILGIVGTVFLILSICWGIFVGVSTVRMMQQNPGQFRTAPGTTVPVVPPAQ